MLLSVGMGSGPHSLLCMMACTRWFSVLPLSSALPSMTVRIPFGSPASHPFWLPDPSSLLYLDVVAALLISSLKFRLLLLLVEAVARRRIHNLLLLHPNFVVVALLLSTLLSPGRRVWGGGVM